MSSDETPYETPRGDIEQTPDGNETQKEIPIERKLQLAERANEIYRDQVKYLQEHLNGMRALIQDKENMIENLMLRFHLGLPQDPSRVDNTPFDDKELRRKAEALAQRTILENFDLRELANQLKDENHSLRTENYALHDAMNRQALHLAKLTKNSSLSNKTNPENAGNNAPMNGGIHPDAVTAEAQRKREERAEKHRRQQSSLAQPNDFWMQNQNANNNDEVDDNEADAQANTEESDTLNPSDHHQMSDRPNKRRKSQKLEDDLRNTEEAKEKRQAREEKDHGRQESGAVPSGIFEPDYANTEEAKKIREERAKKERKESVVIPKNLFTSDQNDDNEDETTREERRKHQRKQSLMKAVGDKGHLSDEDTEKSKNVDYENRRKDRNARPKGKEEGTISEKTEAHHRRESSIPVPDLGFENPALLLAEAQDEVKMLKERLTKIEEEKKTVEKQLQDNKEQAQQLEKRVEEKFQKEKSGLLTNNKKEIEQMTSRVEELKNQLNNVANSKLNLIQCTNSEINRLNRVINILLQTEKCKEITRLVLDDSAKSTNA